jgi:hypothetical protein
LEHCMTRRRSFMARPDRGKTAAAAAGSAKTNRIERLSYLLHKHGLHQDIDVYELDRRMKLIGVSIGQVEKKLLIPAAKLHPEERDRLLSQGGMSRSIEDYMLPILIVVLLAGVFLLAVAFKWRG